MNETDLDRAPDAGTTTEALRRCPMCKVEKFTAEFYRNPKTGRFRAYCKPCYRIWSNKQYGTRKAYFQKRYQEQRASHPEKFLKENRKRDKENERAGNRARYWKNRDARLAYNKEYHKKNRAKVVDSRFIHKYGISYDQYRQMLTAQDGLCAVCRKPEDAIFEKGGTPQRLSVDHDHTCCEGHRSCGKCIRGLLCSGCNSALGLMRDDEARLMLAVEYLRKWKR